MAIITTSTLSLKSPAFKNNGAIPSKYTCDGANINPEINISDIPEETQTLALVVDDPDAPKGTFDHWIIWNIPVKDKIEENTAPGKQGKNSNDEKKYSGPCPSKNTHHYHFRVYALDIELQLDENSDKNNLLKALDGHILATGELIGTYKKNSAKD